MQKFFTVTAAAGLLLSAASVLGCASSDAPSREASSSADYRTGSNIPRKERSGETVKTVDPNSVQAPLPPISRPPAGAGGG